MTFAAFVAEEQESVALVGHPDWTLGESEPVAEQVERRVGGDDLVERRMQPFDAEGCCGRCLRADDDGRHERGDRGDHGAPAPDERSHPARIISAVNAAGAWPSRPRRSRRATGTANSLTHL